MRVFAVGNEVRVEDVVTVQAFRNKMFALVEASLPSRISYVQAGVGDVASHIRLSRGLRDVPGDRDDTYAPG